MAEEAAPDSTPGKVTLDINMQGAYNLNTKNMKRVMSKREKSGTKDEKIKEAKILQESEEEEVVKEHSERPRKKFDYDHIKASNRGSWQDSLNLVSILNNCSSEDQQITTFLHS